MEPDSLSAESAFPPPPPLLPPPVPPPVASPGVSDEGGRSTSLWRWNDRLAIVVGGLTLFLLGIVTGRVFGPDTASDQGGNLITAVSTTSPSVVATDSAPYTEEVNPPESIVCTQAAEPIATPDIVTLAAETTAVVASEPAPTVSTPQPLEQSAAADAPNPETEPATTATTTIAPEAIPQTSLVSLEGKVPTIKPLPSTQVCAAEKKFKDRKLSTALTWAESVQEASQQAEEEQKLIFLIHVSGNFEMPGFT
jgi:hypothetical protein